MAAVPYGSGLTTPRVRAELQNGASVLSRPGPLRSHCIGFAIGTLDYSAQDGFNPKTVLEWRKRPTTKDAAMGTQSPQRRADRGRGGHHRRVQATHSVAARRRDGSPQAPDPQTHLRRAPPPPHPTVLTDNGIAFTKNASTKWDAMRHPFDRACDEHGIQRRLTKPCHPWTNGQAERMNRSVKDATTKVFRHETTQALCAQVLAFVTAYNFAKRLRAFLA